MEALSILIFPFVPTPFRISNFPLKITSDGGKMITVAGKVFIGKRNK